MYIRTFSYNDDKRKIGKTIKKINEYTGVTIAEGTSVINPTIIIGGVTDLAEINNVNYVSIPHVNRFYFVNDIIMDTGCTIKLLCHCDVLETFKKDILKTKQLISRQEKIKNLYIVDSELPIHCDKMIETKLVGEPIIDNTSGSGDGKAYYCFVLETTGK